MREAKMTIAEPQVLQVQPTGEVHPVAELFPMMSDEELDDLAADIQANGLAHPVALDHDGVLIDGRNRMAACKMVGVEPTYRLVDGDPVAFILSSNVARRHLSQGQRAMAVAKACSFSEQTQRQAAKAGGVATGAVGMANVVLQYAPELADQVLAGASLNDAYAEALRRKRLPELEAERKRQEQARRKEEAEDERKLREAIQLALEEIGPEVSITIVPDLDAQMPGWDREAEAKAKPNTRDDQQAELRRIQRLAGVRDALAGLSQEAIPPRLPADVSGVRAVVSQIVQLAYQVAQNYNDALTEAKKLRRVV